MERPFGLGCETTTKDATMVRKNAHNQTTTPNLHMNKFLVYIRRLVLISKCIIVKQFLVDVTLFLKVYGEDKWGD